jgi:1,4-dihydroxy-2-naphthoate polyprenyltransferase
VFFFILFLTLNLTRSTISLRMLDRIETNLTPTRIWTLAARPKTLPAAAATAIVGSAAAFWAGKFQLFPSLACLFGALLIQIGANLANDVYDYYRGADTHERLGPVRVTQAGLLSPGQVLAGMWITFGLAALLGIYLFLHAGWPVLLIGGASILAALAYSGGPLPFGYFGLGDLMVFIFFGPVAVIGTFFVQAKSVEPIAVWSSLPMGFLITGILVVNNLRDIQTDAATGKQTLAVRIGKKGARREFTACVIAAYLVAPVMIAIGVGPVWTLLVFLSLPQAVSQNRLVWRLEGRPLNQALAGAGQLTLVYGLLFSFGLVLSSLTR